MVYVLDKDGRPLMPTTRHGKVRRLLRDGKAVCVRQTPFTIRLLYETTGFTRDVTLGVDAGSKTVGLSATSETMELFKAELTLRNDIVSMLSAMRQARRALRAGWRRPSGRKSIRT